MCQLALAAEFTESHEFNGTVFSSLVCTPEMSHCNVETSWEESDYNVICIVSALIGTLNESTGVHRT